MDALGLCYCLWALEQGLLSSCVAWASQCGAISRCGARALGHASFSICIMWTWLLHGMWNLPGPGIEPVSPALQGGFSILSHQGSPSLCFFIFFYFYFLILFIYLAALGLSCSMWDLAP